MTRQEHLDWAKKRAYEYLEQGDITNAYASFYSDVDKHPDLKYDDFLKGIGLLAHSQTVDAARRYIEGFN